MAAKTVTIEEAAGRLGELLENIDQGDELVIAKGDRPIAKLVPLPSAAETETLPPRTIGDFRGALWIADDFDAPLPDAFWGFEREGV
jgi:antitoxin (DNA-binding transcriptional repressor) of toxin-antitoxin stability system